MQHQWHLISPAGKHVKRIRDATPSVIPPKGLFSKYKHRNPISPFICIIPPLNHTLTNPIHFTTVCACVCESVRVWLIIRGGVNPISASIKSFMLWRKMVDYGGMEIPLESHVKKF